MSDAVHLSGKYILELRKQGIPVQSAFLFGSYAKGNAHAWSDIDVCVISDAFGKDYIDEMVKLKTIALTVDDRIEPIPMTPVGLQDPESTLSSEIRNFSIPISP